jgi:hypothetical protein
MSQEESEKQIDLNVGPNGQNRVGFQKRDSVEFRLGGFHALSIPEVPV